MHSVYHSKGKQCLKQSITIHFQTLSISTSNHCELFLYILLYIHKHMHSPHISTHKAHTSRKTRAQSHKAWHRRNPKTQRQWPVAPRKLPPNLDLTRDSGLVSMHHTLPHYSVSLVQKAVLLLGCLSHSPYQDAKRWHAWTKALRALRSRVKRVYLKLVDL